MDRAIVPKSQILLDLIRREFPSYHPLLSIARIAHNDKADLKLQFECHKTIAKYIEPELKSVEIKGEMATQTRVVVSLFDPIDAEFTEVPREPEAVQHDDSSNSVELPAQALANW